MPEARDSDVAEAIAELDRVRGEWLSRTGVTGVDVGFLMTEDGLSDEIGIRVKVRKKLPPDQVLEGELFPPKLGRFPVQVTESRPAPE